MSKSLFEEKKHVTELLSKHSEQICGEFWYMIEKSWFKTWKRYIEQKINHNEELRFAEPKEINNFPLLSSQNQLKNNLIQDLDYVAVHSKVWEYSGGPVIKYVIQEAQNNNENINEKKLMYFYYYKFMNSKYQLITIIQFRLTNKVSDIWDQISNIIKTPAKLIRIYLMDKNEKKSHELINFTKKSILHYFKEDTKLIFDIADSSNKTTLNPIIEQQYMYAGLTGIRNIGNSCWFISAIQCLLNTQPLCEYFLTQKHLLDINTTNPLGMKGELAACFSKMCQDYWSGNYSIISMQELKSVIGNFSTQFKTNDQFDSHELITFLIDALHEDLNRILKKPYIEEITGKNNVDLKKLAKESLSNFKKRNDSFICDKFQGLLLNKLKCTSCDLISYKFEPMMSLSIPLVTKKNNEYDVVVIPIDRSIEPIMQYHVTSKKSEGLKGFLKSLSGMCGIEGESLQLTDVFGSSIYKIHNTERSFENIRKSDNLVAYQIPKYDKYNEVLIPIYFYYLNGTQDYRFGYPGRIKLKIREINYDEFFKLLNEKIYELLPNLEEYCKNFEEGNFEIITNLKINSNEQNKNNSNKFKKNKRILNQEEKQELYEQYGFKKSKFTPAYKISIGKQNFSGRFEEEFIDFESKSNTTFLIHEKIRIGIKLNPIFTDKFPQYINLISKFNKHESVNIYQEKVKELKLKNKFGIPLELCIKNFLQEEQLSDNNEWFCPSCKKHINAIKKISIWDLPEILIIQLKRFQNNNFFRSKLQSLIDFPLVLDISDYINDNLNLSRFKYQLFAISNHDGAFNGGHYYSYCKNFKSDIWFKYNDSVISEITDLGSLKTESAYILLYQRI
ncbi:ubiquitin carboxyl-terminal hydrolase [Anaeramoeba flamelloides]|uniref:Ubiquitin carboxyl-terminal hydrolase n=1 Tax=Anaeramoeba flamelloides TaxID=1746091 RepID=A0AAV7YNN1_9EUKA|nr:ubiquitin carboxyl-terminal hydrolase [Anaeramoeba flamelloides]